MEHSSSHYDIIIVGARVAGSLTGVMLAQQGHRLLMLDRAHFPSDTLSTHFFRAPSFRAFRQIGVLDHVLDAAPHLTMNYNVIDEHVFPEPYEGDEEYPFCISLRRIVLDDILNQRVKAFENIDLHEGAIVDALLREDERVIGVTWTEDGQRFEATARAVIGADGLHSFVAKEVEPEVELEEPFNRAMYYAYYRDFAWHDGPAAEFHYQGDHLAYVFPSDDELTLLAITLPRAMFDEFKKDHVARFEQEMKTFPELADRFRAATREGKVLGTASIPGYVRVPYGEGWALVGDAALVMDPWSGQGIDMASTGSMLLAEHMHRFLSGSADWEQAMRAYHEARNAACLRTYKSTSRLSRDLTQLTGPALARRGLA